MIIEKSPFYNKKIDLSKENSEKLIEKIDQVLKKDKDEWTKFTKKVFTKKSFILFLILFIIC